MMFSLIYLSKNIDRNSKQSDYPSIVTLAALDRAPEQPNRKTVKGLGESIYYLNC